MESINLFMPIMTALESSSQYLAAASLWRFDARPLSPLSSAIILFIFYIYG